MSVPIKKPIEDIHARWLKAIDEFASNRNFYAFAKATTAIEMDVLTPNSFNANIFSLSAGIAMAETSAQLAGFVMPLREGGVAHVEKLLLANEQQPQSFARAFKNLTESLLTDAEDRGPLGTSALSRSLQIENTVKECRGKLGLTSNDGGGLYGTRYNIRLSVPSF